jgi:hypothetical protein
VLLALASSVHAEPSISDVDLLARAEAEFQQGIELRGRSAEATRHFRSATDCYVELRERGHMVAPLCRNAGNAAWLAGDLPLAILSYRQALRLAPRDHEAETNLAFAREQVAYAQNGAFARPAADQRPYAHLVSPLAFLLLGLAFWSLASWATTRWFMTRDPKHRMLAGLALLGAVVALVTLFVDRRHSLDEAAHPLVVIAEDGLLLRKGNGLSYPPRVATGLNRGVEARLVYDKGDWLQIELSSGEVGWVARKAVLVDEIAG